MKKYFLIVLSLIIVVLLAFSFTACDDIIDETPPQKLEIKDNYYFNTYYLSKVITYNDDMVVDIEDYTHRRENSFNILIDEYLSSVGTTIELTKDSITFSGALKDSLEYDVKNNQLNESFIGAHFWSNGAIITLTDDQKLNNDFLFEKDIELGFYPYNSYESKRGIVIKSKCEEYSKRWHSFIYCLDKEFPSVWSELKDYSLSGSPECPEILIPANCTEYFTFECGFSAEYVFNFVKDYHKEANFFISVKNKGVEINDNDGVYEFFAGQKYELAISSGFPNGANALLYIQPKTFEISTETPISVNIPANGSKVLRLKGSGGFSAMSTNNNIKIGGISNYSIQNNCNVSVLDFCVSLEIVNGQIQYAYIYLNNNSNTAQETQIVFTTAEVLDARNDNPVVIDIEPECNKIFGFKIEKSGYYEIDFEFESQSSFTYIFSPSGTQIWERESIYLIETSFSELATPGGLSEQKIRNEFFIIFKGITKCTVTFYEINLPSESV